MKEDIRDKLRKRYLKEIKESTSVPMVRGRCWDSGSSEPESSRANMGQDLKKSLEVPSTKSTIGQVQHHAMHVLTFILIMGRDALRGGRVRVRVLRRIIYHPIQLREFVEDARLSELINLFILSLQHEERSQDSRVCMYAWLCEQERFILEFARHYKQGELFSRLLPIQTPRTVDCDEDLSL